MAGEYDPELAEALYTRGVSYFRDLDRQNPIPGDTGVRALPPGSPIPEAPPPSPAPPSVMPITTPLPELPAGPGPGSGNQFYAPASPSTEPYVGPGSPGQGLSLAQALRLNTPAGGSSVRGRSGDLKRLFDQQKMSIEQEFEARASQADERAGQLQDLLNRKRDLNKRRDVEDDKHRKKYGEAWERYERLSREADKDLDPNAWAKAQGVAGSLAHMMLAAFEGALRPGQENTILRGMDAAIERSLRMQEADRQNKGRLASQQMDLLNYMRAAYKDEGQAMEAAKARMVDETSTQLESLAEKTKNKVLRAKMFQTINTMDMDNMKRKIAIARSVKRKTPLQRIAETSRLQAQINKNLGVATDPDDALKRLRLKREMAKPMPGEFEKQKLSGEAFKELQSIRTGLDLADEIEQMYNDKDNWRLKLPLSQKREYFGQVSQRLINRMLRRDSGAAISDDEWKRAKEMMPGLPSSYNDFVNGLATQRLKLRGLRKELQSRGKSIVDNFVVSPRDRVRLSGARSQRRRP